jgi:transcriptional regulator with XRE-family HTH domain
MTESSLNEARDSYKAELARYLKGFGENVRRVRVANDISQEALAFRTRLHRTEVGKIEQGLVEPGLTTLAILADGLGVSVTDLMSDLEVPEERRPAPYNRYAGPAG